MKIFDSTLIYPIFDVESIGDGPRVPRAHLEVVLTQLLASPAHPLYSLTASRAPYGALSGRRQRCRKKRSFLPCPAALEALCGTTQAVQVMPTPHARAPCTGSCLAPVH